MTDNGPEKKGDRAEAIEQILAERERLEQILEEKFIREIAILFSDICDYTRYVDRYGDISGRSMLRKHNQLVLPNVENFDGRVVEVIGDAVMAAFPDPVQAVHSAVAIHEQLAAYNASVAEKDAIHVKIGIHLGRVLVDEAAQHQKLAGDVANLAARIQAHAQKDQILISDALYERVCDCDEILCRFHDAVALKGKSQVQKTYRVVWQNQELLSPAGTQFRMYQEPAASAPEESPRVFNLEVSREGQKLLVSALEGARGESRTIRDYETVDASMERIDTRCVELVESFNRANRGGRVTREVFLQLREIGQILYDDLFTAGIKERLQFSHAMFLCLNLDESLVHIPWELLHDGRRFLCERFAVGRSVKTHRRLCGIQERTLARPLRLLIVADPTGDLQSAYEEGTRIRDLLDGHVDLFNVGLRSDAISVESIRKKLRNFDIVHFAGHADLKSEKPEQSGWRLSDGFFSNADIDRMAGAAAMPALIFSNSCQSARTQNTLLAPDVQREIFGMANSFLLAGVKHYVGTFWEIQDEPSSRFALEFYGNLSNGTSIGEAVQLSRQTLIRQYGEDNIVWASYLLYGDPTYNYVQQVAPRATRPRPSGEPIQTARGTVRTREEVIDFAKSETLGKKKFRWIVATVLLLMFLALAAVYLWQDRGNPAGLEQSAQAAFRNGKYTEAAQTCAALQQQFPERPLSHRLLGDIHFLENQPEKARLQYQQAVNAGEPMTAEAARALIGLGRLASMEGNTDEALAYYYQAQERSPGNRRALISQAALLTEAGRYEQSLKVFGMAGSNGQSEPVLNATMNEVRRRWQWERDGQRQQRIDQLVDELVARIETSAPAAPSEDWSSAPLTVWLMDVEARGPIMLEGATLLIHSMLMEELLQHSRVQVVERGLMDKLLEELRIGSGNLADRDTALALGKIAAAQVILAGHLTQQGALQQVFVRAIETETGQIFASDNQALDPDRDFSGKIRSMGAALIEKLDQRFPLRGKIVGIDGNLAVLDIGSRHGAAVGQLFRVLNSRNFLRIDSVLADQSFARATEGAPTLTPGSRVQLYERNF